MVHLQKVLPEGLTRRSTSRGVTPGSVSGGPGRSRGTRGERTARTPRKERPCWEAGWTIPSVSQKHLYIIDIIYVMYPLCYTSWTESWGLQPATIIHSNSAETSLILQLPLAQCRGAPWQDTYECERVYKWVNAVLHW